MKHLYYYTSFLLLLFGLSPLSSSATITLSTNTSCPDVTLHAQFGQHSSTVDYKIYWGDGSFDVITIFPQNNSFNKNHIYAQGGIYTIKAVFELNGTPIDSAITSYTYQCSYVILSSYLDDNNNCLQDNNEADLQTHNQIEVDSAGNVIDTINTFGKYYYNTDSGVAYKFKTISSSTNVGVTCPISKTISVTGPGTGASNTVTAKFGLTCNTSQFDLGVYASGRFRPVSTSIITLNAYNNSCTTKSGIVTLNIDNKYDFYSASVTPASVQGNVVKWNVTDLSIRASKTIEVLVKPSAGANIKLGDTICNTAQISPTAGDVNTANNVFNNCEQVIASWDPNNKTVDPVAEIPTGVSTLTYTINFENLGSDTAFNIHIYDTLSEHLNPKSIRVINSSHTMNYFFTDKNSNIIKFEFPNIRLADSNSKTFNKGFVTFKIDTKRLTQDGTIVKNRAGIYFDVNPVVLTDYAINRVSILSINKGETKRNIKLYPNPVTDVITIQTARAYKELKLYNNMGQVIQHKILNSNNTQIKMKHLPRGMYYIQLTGDNNTVTQKVEKL